MDMKVEKIISGGQTGADQGGLRAGKALGLQTGGYAPKGFRTLIGPDTRLRSYGLKETESSDYPPRTKKNVQSSDGTIRFARNFNSYGEICTLKAIMQSGKPFMDVDLRKMPNVSKVRNWLIKNKIRILNIAGNADSPGSKAISDQVKAYLIKVFKE